MSIALLKIHLNITFLQNEVSCWRCSKNPNRYIGLFKYESNKGCNKDMHRLATCWYGPKLDPYQAKNNNTYNLEPDQS